MREAEELQSWLARQTQAARGAESLGENYEHILVSEGLGQGEAMRQNAGAKGAGLAGLCGEGGHGSNEPWLRTDLWVEWAGAAAVQCLVA